MKRNKQDELKAITITKRTCSDINQLFSELGAELSEEYLRADDPKVAEKIKNALTEFNAFHDHFLTAYKSAMDILREAVADENEIAMLAKEAQEAAEVAKKILNDRAEAREKEEKTILPL